MDSVEPKYVSLKEHTTYNERWLHQRILKDPSVLGLRDLSVRDDERSQPNVGRLDLLLFNPEPDTRYEAELQLSSTDESHFIRVRENMLVPDLRLHSIRILDREIDESSLEQLPYKHNQFRVRIRKSVLDESRRVIEG